MDTKEKQINEILERGTIVEVLPTKKEFKKRLLSGDKLKFYIGFDATAPTLHLSHAKNLILLEKFRKLGHEVIILFGDFTARIGDPSGENSVRKQLSKEEVDENVSKWKELIKPLMDFADKKNPPKIMYNNSWFSEIDLEELLKLASNFTVQQMVERDMFAKRIEEGKPVYLHEFLYPLMQGYDSVMLDVDAELCGTDQIFNALAGRTLLKKLKNKDKFVVAVTLMENPKTGELMSKSKGTGVFLDVSAQDMYGQIMAQPDEMIEVLFINCTYLSLEDIKKMNIAKNPLEAKMQLALEITKIFHGEKEADKAKEDFVNTFQKGGTPDKIEEVSIAASGNLVDTLVENGIIESKSQVRRLLDDGAVKISGEKIYDDLRLEPGQEIQVGKKKWVKVI